MMEMIIKEKHVDSLGHMNNATYLELFEEARWDAITDRGYSFHTVQQTQQAPVILEINIKFLKEIRLREKITITFDMVDYQGLVGRLKQTMVKDDNSIAAEAMISFGLFDLKTRRLINPTEAWKKALGLA